MVVELLSHVMSGCPKLEPLKGNMHYLQRYYGFYHFSCLTLGANILSLTYYLKT